MSDVLRRLALRVLPGAGEGVRPRLGSRFEAVAAGVDFPGSRLADAWAGAPAATVEHTEAVAAQTAVPPAVPAPAPANPSAAPHSLSAFSSEPAGEAFGPLPAAVAAPAVAEARGAPAMDTVFPPPAGAPAAVAMPRGSDGGSAGADAAPPGPVRSDAPVRRGSTPQALPASRPPDLLLPEMRHPPEAETGAAAAPPFRREEPVSDIRISIGRIDVRAGKDPRTAPPQTRPRARASLMSLEDYLGRGRSRP